MGGFGMPEYWMFEDYQEDVLDPRSKIEQLTLLDTEITNEALLPRYQSDLEANEWPRLERYYSQLFAGFILDRVGGIIDTKPVKEYETRFHEFRHHVIELNQLLPRGSSGSTTTISEPAERILLKRLRQQGYDPSALDIQHISHGGGLYLLELFVTAAQQESATDESLLTTLIDQASQLDQVGKEDALAILSYPVLMVRLWENQETGLEKWLANGGEGILEMATATGKTVAGIAAIADVCGDIPEDDSQAPETECAKIMIVAHSNAILSQWEREIRDKLGLATSALSGGGRPDRLSFATGTVEFYTAQSLLPRYDRDLHDEYDLVIYDEVHHYSNLDGFGKAIQRPNYKRAMGLSATIGDETDPKRRRLQEVLAPVVYTYDVQDARRDGIIPEFDWTVHPTALDPYERDEWKQTTESITNQFRALRYDDETTRILRKLSVPFVELEDLGDFIQAHQAAELELDGKVPDSWGRLQASIQSRNWIRHRSQPKLDGALELAREYLTGADSGVKIVMFAMDIETTEQIGEALSDVTENTFVVHSQVASSTRKKDEIVNQRIEQFGKADHGVLIAPKILDEGIDVPDAEVGINVAGTKTKLQLVQRMGRILRRYGDQKPHFHHFVAVPDEFHIEGLDSKQYVQELNWVRELGETISKQPVIERAHVDEDVLDRAEERGNELWARDLLADLEVETVQGSVHLDELISALTLSSAETLRSTVDFSQEEVVESDWKTAMTLLREDETLPIETLQRVWWLFPIYRDRPEQLLTLLDAVIDERQKQETDSISLDENKPDVQTESESAQKPSQSDTTPDSENARAPDADRDTHVPAEPNSNQKDQETDSGGHGLIQRIKSLF